jgi:transcriptional regulator with XRE-family HTH domain
MKRRIPALVTLGLNVRRRREELDFTQEKLAEKADLDQTYISGIERGLRNPGILNVARLAKALSIPTSRICTGVDL